MSFIVRTVFLCTALNVVAACSQRQSVQPVAEAAVHVSIGALVYDVTLKDDGVEVERRPFALYANALGKQYPVKKVFLKGDAYKVESLAKILLKEGWTKGASSSGRGGRFSACPRRKEISSGTFRKRQYRHLQGT